MQNDIRFSFLFVFKLACVIAKYFRNETISKQSYRIWLEIILHRIMKHHIQLCLIINDKNDDDWQ